jgi:hypothetical protein
MEVNKMSCKNNFRFLEDLTEFYIQDSGDFPTLEEAKKGKIYRIKAINGVVDNDPFKTNTGMKFLFDQYITFDSYKKNWMIVQMNDSLESRMLELEKKVDNIMEKLKNDK